MTVPPYPQQPPYSSRGGPPPEKRRRWPIVVYAVLIGLVIGGVLAGIAGMSGFAPAEEDMVPVQGPTQVNFTEGETYWVYVPQAESGVAQCEVTATDGSPVPGTASSTTYTVSYHGEPYTTITTLPPTKPDPTASGVSHTVTCDTENAIAGPAPNTGALGLGIAGIMVAALSFIGCVGLIVVRTWIRVLSSRRGPLLGR